jgi:hypothetical protein
VAEYIPTFLSICIPVLASCPRLKTQAMRIDYRGGGGGGLYNSTLAYGNIAAEMNILQRIIF